LALFEWNGVDAKAKRVLLLREGKQLLADIAQKEERYGGSS